MREYGFHERLAWSDGFATNSVDVFSRILKARIPGCYDVTKADLQNDRNGTDYFAWRTDTLPLSIDVKVRSEDYAVRGQDDLALETWSIYPTKIGWTRDAKKQTDFILWYWTTTGRFALVPFPPLCAVFQLHWQEWLETYGGHGQNSGTWESECVFVPRVLVYDRITAWCGGQLPVLPKLVPITPCNV